MTTADATAAAQIPLSRPEFKKRHIAAVVIGNALEFYDFLTYSFFSVYIGRAFFPSTEGRESLLLSLATFGIGFVARPIGGIVIGTMGDRIGRKPAMVLSFTLMGIAITGLALTPSYATIGIAAPILVVIFRLLQGFALGGEVGPTTAFLVEAAPPQHRGFYSSLQYTTQDLAILTAGIVGTVLASYMNEQELQDWGWRIAMLLGALIVPFGLALRRSLPESLHAADDAALAPDATAGTITRFERLRPYLRIAVLGLIMLAGGTMVSYVINYLTTYALDSLHLAAQYAFGATVTSGLCGVLLEPVSGWLSDRYGRKPVMMIPWALLLITVLPAFALMDQLRTAEALYGATAVLAILAALATPPVLTSISESLPPSIRSGTLAIIYAFAISIFGGSTQFTVTWLIDVTGNPLAPAWYSMAAVIIGLIAMIGLRESAPIKQKPEKGSSRL